MAKLKYVMVAKYLMREEDGSTYEIEKSSVYSVDELIGDMMSDAISGTPRGGDLLRVSVMFDEVSLREDTEKRLKQMRRASAEE